ncbi:hypothetical protein NTGBS_340003 [Candidatus Nitrotoga sp. BS]|nr:hypothetical protein NTGBS_340003 [Candidatus Nitrotoga sp. BS]
MLLPVDTLYGEKFGLVGQVGIAGGGE